MICTTRKVRVPEIEISNDQDTILKYPTDEIYILDIFSEHGFGAIAN